MLLFIKSLFLLRKLKLYFGLLFFISSSSYSSSRQSNPKLRFYLYINFDFSWAEAYLDIFLEILSVNRGNPSKLWLDEYVGNFFFCKELIIIELSIALYYINFIMDSKIDKEIQELLLIRLGLENKSEQLFKQLLSGKVNDPLDDIFKSMLNKNLQIQNLKKEVFLLKQQNKKLKAQDGGSFTKTQKIHRNDSQFRSMSLPPNHEQDKQNIELKKKSAEALKEQYKKNVQKYIVFLMKCIRQVSKSHITRQEDAEKMIANLQQSLQRQRDRVLQQTGAKEGPFFMQSTLSQASTQSSKKADENLQKLIKSLNQTKDPQRMFEKINEALGLKQDWDIYINKLKEQSRMFYFLKDMLYQMEKQNTKISLQQIQSYNQQRFSWKMMADRIFNDVMEKTSNNKIKSNVDEILQKTKNQLTLVPQKSYALINQTMSYFYQKLDEMFKKHNQHPYRMSVRPQFKQFGQKLQTLIKQKQWEQALEAVKAQINQAFYLIQRRTKFHSANRMILRKNE